jgi:hypothetical protein
MFGSPPLPYSVEYSVTAQKLLVSNIWLNALSSLASSSQVMEENLPKFGPEVAFAKSELQSVSINMLGLMLDIAEVLVTFMETVDIGVVPLGVLNEERLVDTVDNEFTARVGADDTAALVATGDVVDRGIAVVLLDQCSSEVFDPWESVQFDTNDENVVLEKRGGLEEAVKDTTVPVLRMIEFAVELRQVLLGETVVLDTSSVLIVLLHSDESEELLASFMLLDDMGADTMVV